MNSGKSFDNVTCAFCGLTCDDLKIQQNGVQLEVKGELPELCRSHFENSAQQHLDAQPTVNGQVVKFEEAIAEACRLIEGAQRPLLGGLLLDIQGSQEAVKLAVDCGAVVDHYNSDAVLRNVKVLQNTGAILASLSEVRVRADFIVIIGDQVLDNFPRLNERILSGPRPLAGNASPQFAFIGPCANNIPDNMRADTFASLAVEKSEIHACIEMLSAVAHQHPVSDERSATLEKIVHKIQQSNYSCVVWDANDLDYPNAELSIEVLTLLLRKFNQQVRCVGVPMGSNGLTFHNVCLWQTAYPVRTSFDRTPPVFDPIANTTAKLLKEREVDLLIWSAALRSIPPPVCDIPTIALTRPDTVLQHPVAVHIPVGIPGIDHGGHIFRSDSVTILPMKQLRQTNLMPASKVFAALREKLSTSESALC